LHQENPRASPEAKQRLGNIYKYKNKLFSALLAVAAFYGAQMPN
jgi:hypothetical protein